MGEAAGSNRVACPQDRILVCGLQSSGATLVALLLSQDPSTVGVLDLFCGERMPSVEYLPQDRSLVLKMTFSTFWGLEEQIDRFQATRTVLVLRHPAHNYVSLDSKYYRDYGGMLEDKFAVLERVFEQRERFDSIIHYEDVVMRPSAVMSQLRQIQPGIDKSALQLARTRSSLIEDACRYAWLKATLRGAWEVGNVHESPGLDPLSVFKDVPPDITEVVAKLCPKTNEYSDNFYSAEYSARRVRLHLWMQRRVYMSAREHAKQSKRALRLAAHRMRSVLL